MRNSKLNRPPDNVVLVAGEVLRAKPDADGWRDTCDADIQLLTDYKSRRSVETALDDLHVAGLLDVGDVAGGDGRGCRRIRVLDHKAWGPLLALIDLAEVWS